MTYTSSNLDRFNTTFARYYAAGKKSWQECVAKQAKEYARDLSNSARDMAPAPGSIRTRLLAMLKSGRGLLIKDYRMPGLKVGAGTSQRSLVEKRLYGALKNTKRNRERTSEVKAMYLNTIAAMSRKGISEGGAKRLGFQALLAANEIKMRESKRMFTRASAMFKWQDWAHAQSKKGQTSLGTFKAKETSQGTEGEFLWGDAVGYQSSKAAYILGGTSKGKAIMAEAFRRRIADMEKYIAGKHIAAARAAGGRQ